jgi:hypothetical protein
VEAAQHKPVLQQQRSGVLQHDLWQGRLPWYAAWHSSLQLVAASPIEASQRLAGMPGLMATSHWHAQLLVLVHGALTRCCCCPAASMLAGCTTKQLVVNPVMWRTSLLCCLGPQQMCTSWRVAFCGPLLCRHKTLSRYDQMVQEDAQQLV